MVCKSQVTTWTGQGHWLFTLLIIFLTTMLLIIRDDCHKAASGKIFSNYFTIGLGHAGSVGKASTKGCIADNLAIFKGEWLLISC